MSMIAFVLNHNVVLIVVRREVVIDSIITSIGSARQVRQFDDKLSTR